MCRTACQRVSRCQRVPVCGQVDQKMTDLQDELERSPVKNPKRKRTMYFLERLDGDRGRFCEVVENSLKEVSCGVRLQRVSASFNWDRYAVLRDELYFIEYGHVKIFDMKTGELLDTVSVPLDSVGGITMFEADLFIWTVRDIYQIVRCDATKTQLVKVGACQIKEPLQMVRILRREERRLEVVATFNTIYGDAHEGTWRLVLIDVTSLISEAKLHDGRLAGVFNNLVYVHYTNSPRESELIALAVKRFSSNTVTVSRHSVLPSSWSVAVCDEGYVRLCYQSDSGKGFLEIVDIRQWQTICKESTGPDLCRWVDCAPVPVLLDD